MSVCKFSYIHTYIRNFSLITLDSELQLNNFGSGTLAQEPLLENSPICTSTEKTTICTDTRGGAPQPGQVGTNSCTYIHNYYNIPKKKTIWTGSIWAGNIWQHLGSSLASGMIWQHLGALGSIWEHLEASGSIWKHHEAYSIGVPLTHLVLSCLTWSHLVVYDFHWFHSPPMCLT